MPKKAKKNDRIIYISELCEIVNRKRNTIYKWEHSGRLPKHLIPQRGYKGWRCWTYEQVYGKNGIIAWMKANDIRPGNFITDPSREAQHIASLRRPKYLTKNDINRVLTWIEKGWGAKKIAQRLLAIHVKQDRNPRYKRWQNVDRALRAYFEATGMGMAYPVEDEGERQVKKLINSFDHAERSGDNERAIKLVLR
jgi:predicted DNA-binding transcriptional regulator AlpA